jgi:hypothetical protein
MKQYGSRLTHLEKIVEHTRVNIKRLSSILKYDNSGSNF